MGIADLFTVLPVLGSEEGHDTSAYCKAIRPPNYHDNSCKPLIPAALIVLIRRRAQANSSACRCKDLSGSESRRPQWAGWPPQIARFFAPRLRHGKGAAGCNNLHAFAHKPRKRRALTDPLWEGLSHNRLHPGLRVPRPKMQVAAFKGLCPFGQRAEIWRKSCI